MGIKEIKRFGIPIVIIWIFVGSVSYVIFGNRDLFECITLLIFGTYISLDIKTKWISILIIFLLTWNVVEESVVILSRNEFNLMAGIWIKIVFTILSVMVIGLIKEKKFA